MAGVFNSIPYFGPVIVTGALCAIVAFLQFGTFTMALAVAGIALRDHVARGLVPDADAAQPRRQYEPGRGVRRA